MLRYLQYSVLGKGHLMKISKYVLAAVLGMLMSTSANAQTKPATVLSNVKNKIGVTATANIENAERLFCYQVSAKPQNYTGYTIDNMAITGFCGVIDDNLRNMLTEQIFGNDENIDFINTDNCTIQPRILLRYVRGVDNTDVLLSLPCPSASVFYGGNISTFNMKPATELLTTVINAFKASQLKFVSPALLNQLLPIGVAQTSEQKALLNQSAQPKRNWGNTASEPAKPANQGWNSLNFSK